MPFQSISDDPFILRLVAAGLLAGSVVAASIVYAVLRFAGRALRRTTAHAILPDTVAAVRNSATLFVVAAGVFLALSALPETEAWTGAIETIWVIVAVLLVAHAISNTTSAAINWYLVTIAPRTPTQIDDRMLPLARRLLTIVIYGIAGLLVLDALGQSISPILGGLGITGLAVALAVQPTLSNFFAGTYVLSDGAIGVGDYIELNGGPAGYVKEVGWRSTKIQTWLNNLVIIPNSVMADSIVTNYSGPIPAMNILLMSGVSYDSDLDRVEEVALEVTREVIRDQPDAVKTMDAYFGFDSFGESNIKFWLFLQARDRLGSFVVTNELIKRLRARFKTEWIQINYPVRQLVDNRGLPVSGVTDATPA